MASAKAWGTITIVDTTDIGQFSVTPSSNRTTTVIYTPDDNTYTPDWADSSGNVTITPIVYYGGTQLTPGIASTSNPKVTWAYKTNGSTTFTTITSSAPSWAKPQADGTLKLTGNPFTSTSISSVTFKCAANYNEPATNLPLTAAGEITYSVVRHAASVPYCRISGETIFKYDTSQQPVGSEKITLTVANEHCSISKWQYKNAQGNWTDINSTATTMEVSRTSAYFVNNVATLKVLTNVADLYDIHVITKIYDGAAGQSTIAAVLTNEDQIIPCNSAGTPVQNAFLDAVTQLLIYRGGTEETGQWSIAITSSDGVSYEKSTDGTDNSWVNSSTEGLHYDHVKIKGMTVDVGSVTFTATKPGETTLVKKFSLSKIKTGADGADAMSYMIDLSRNIVHVDEKNALKDGNITLKLYSRKGSEDRALYSGRIKAYEGNSTSAFYTHGTNANTYTLTNSGSNSGATIGTIIPKVISAGSVRIEMFKSGGTSTLLDTQTITLVKDGATGPKGATGANGTSPINVVLGNYSDSIACDKSNAILPTNTAKVLEIPFAAYEGTNRVACTTDKNSIKIAYKTSTAEIIPNVTASSTNSDGLIRYTFPAGATIDDAHANITVSIVFTVTKSNGTTANVLANYSISRVSTGATGSNGSSPYGGFVETPDGTVFVNGTGTLSLEAHMFQGATDTTEAAGSVHNHTLYKWFRRDGNSWTRINDDEFGSNSVSIGAGEVDSIGWYKCEIYYNGTSAKVEATTTLRITLYVTLIDKTDPIQAEILSTAGDKFVNGIAEGAMYVKVYRNGVEIDPLPTEVISKTAPASPSANQMYFKIDTATNSVKLMKYVSNAWAEQTYTPTASYTWSYLDKDGKETHPSGMATSGKIIYVDGDFVNVKLTAFCEVEV